MIQHPIYDPDTYEMYNPKILKPGAHICSLYDTEEQCFNTLTYYILEGLLNNEKVIYIACEDNKQIALNQLDASITHLDKYLRNGQLTVQTPKDIYLKTGVFCVNKVIDFLKETAFKNNQEEYPLFRIVADMSWVLTHHISIDDVLHYEARVNREFYWDHKCVGLCQYDTRLFSHDILNAQFDLHTVCQIGREFYPNQFYIPPESYLTGDSEKVVLHHRIHEIKERKIKEKHVAFLYQQTEDLREFSHLLTHDLIEPIDTARNTVEKLKENPSSEEVEHLLFTINQAKNLLDNINHLNTVRLQEKAKRHINLNLLLAELIQNYQEEIQRINGSFEFIQGKIKIIYANKKQILQLFSNLINNSIKYRKEEENLKITLSTQMVDAHSIKVSVQDNGKGFPPYMKEKIFSPFFRSHTVFGIEGAGIGLAICQNIIQKYNGTMNATSTEGNGATFDVFFPV